MTDQHSEHISPTVSVLVSKDDRILLEKRQHSHGADTWGPPTGHLDFGETPEQTATRETFEETGVTLSNVKFHAVTNDIFENEHYHTVTIWMKADYQSGTPKVQAPDEESEVGWFAWDALPNPLYIPFANLLQGHTYPSPTSEDAIGQAIEILHESPTPTIENSEE